MGGRKKTEKVISVCLAEVMSGEVFLFISLCLGRAGGGRAGWAGTALGACRCWASLAGTSQVAFNEKCSSPTGSLSLRGAVKALTWSGTKEWEVLN